MLSTYNRKARNRRNRNRDERTEILVQTFKYERPDIDSSHILDSVNLISTFSLYDYQRDCIAYMQLREALYDTEEQRGMNNGHRGVRGGILAVEMGLGKTLMGISLHLIQRELLDSNKPTLVLCSKSIMNVWKNEIYKFYGESVKVLIFHADFMSRKQIDATKPDDFLKYDIIITTYHMICGANPKKEYEVHDKTQKHGKHSYALTEFGSSTTIQAGRALSQREQGIVDDSRYMNKKLGKESLMYFYWERVIVDESQVMRNFRTHTYKSFLCLSAKYKWCFSGTPMVNVETDLWTQFRFCGYLSVKYPKDWNYETYLRDGMYESVYILSKEDAGMIPPERTDVAVICEMSDDEQKIYEACLGQLRNAYTQYLTNIAGFAHVLVRWTRLRQACVAPYLLNTAEQWNRDSYVHKREEAGIQASKIRKAAQLIEESKLDDKFLIFSFFKDTPFLISEHLDDNTFAYDSTFKVLFLSYGTGSEGLNLASANRVILVEPWWNPSKHEQAIARAWRNGQTREVRVEYLLVEGTIENRIREICAAKRSMTANYLGGNKTTTHRDSDTPNAALMAKILGLN